MTIEAMAASARELGQEFFIDGDGDVCIRPMIWENGSRTVRYRPDPCEYIRPEAAEARLLALRKRVGGAR